MISIVGKASLKRTNASDSQSLSVGEIKIGGSSLFSAFVIPEMISGFNKKYPRISIKIFENNTKDLIHELISGELDIIIDNADIKNENITPVFLKKERLLLAVPEGFCLNDEVKAYGMSGEDVKASRYPMEGCGVMLSDFKHLPFILLNSENDTGKRADILFKKHKINPHICFRLDQQMTAYNVTCQGMGVSFISDTLIKKIDSSPAVRYYRLCDGETERNIYFYLKKNQYHTVATQRFVEENT